MVNKNLVYTTKKILLFDSAAMFILAVIHTSVKKNKNIKQFEKSIENIYI